jgi:hypothetical protein
MSRRSLKPLAIVLPAAATLFLFLYVSSWSGRLALAGNRREDTDDFRNVFCLRDPIDR